MILVTGASGLVGSELVSSLRARGEQVLRLVRKHSTAPDAVSWNIKGALDLPPGPLNSVVHLAGEPVMGFWTRRKKDAIRQSRVQGTRQVAEYIAGLEQKPSSLICASAVGYYGSRGNEELTEASGPGDGFLAETCVWWEAAAQAARDAGIPVVHLRIGIVLTAKGGALPAMATPFKLGMGSRLGDGKHWVPWISLPDLVRLIEFCIDHPEVAGPVNAVAPQPVTNVEMSRAIAEAVHRWVLPIPIPAFALRLLPGGIADEALLASAKVVPARAQGLGFQFESPELLPLLQRELS